jgi:hypothetical protein
MLRSRLPSRFSSAVIAATAGLASAIGAVGPSCMSTPADISVWVWSGYARAARGPLRVAPCAISGGT